MGREFVEMRITLAWESFEWTPEAVRPRLLDWPVDAKGRHVAWRYRIRATAGRPTEVVVQRRRPAPVDQRRRRVPEGRGRAPRRSTVAQTAMAARSMCDGPGAAAVDAGCGRGWSSWNWGLWPRRRARRSSAGHATVVVSTGRTRHRSRKSRTREPPTPGYFLMAGIGARFASGQMRCR